MPELNGTHSLEEALHVANQQVAAIAAISHDAVVGVKPDGRIFQWNAAAEQLFEYSESDAIGMNLLTLSAPPSPQVLVEFMRRVSAGETVASYDTKLLSRSNKLLDVSLAAAPVKFNDGLLHGAIVIAKDISLRIDWEIRQRAMTRELAHRVKNSFAILQSILYSTLKTSPEPKEFAKVFSSRLHSLASAQDILTANDWRGIELGALVRHQLASYDKLDGVKLRVSGPYVALASHYAVPFGLIFNELAANAFQHGAWSSPLGKVDLSWRVEHAMNGNSKLFVVWQERGGPKPSALRSPGLGVILIEKGLAGANVVSNYDAQGLTCTIELEFSPCSALN